MAHVIDIRTRSEYVEPDPVPNIACPHCGSEWFITKVTFDRTPRVVGYGAIIQCAECDNQYDLSISGSGT